MCESESKQLAFKHGVALKRAGDLVCCAECVYLAAKAVEGAALSLQGVDDVHGGHRLPLRVLGVGDGIADHVLQEDLQYTARLLVDQARDTLHTATTRQTADGRLGDSLDVVSQHLPVSLGATLSQTLASFTTSRHIE